jgi:hypothetical protein
MISKAILAKMNGSGHLLHVSRKDSAGHPLVARLNGKLKTWVTKPLKFKQPMKHGLRNYFYVTEEELDEWEPMTESVV